MYEYYLCEFEYKYVGQFYQEVFNREVVRHVDLDGNTIILEGAYGYKLLDVNPEKPSWGL